MAREGKLISSGDPARSIQKHRVQFRPAVSGKQALEGSGLAEFVQNRLRSGLLGAQVDRASGARLERAGRGGYVCLMCDLGILGSC
jgi:hypothetical protein